jgi:hypothetical protein
MKNAILFFVLVLIGGSAFSQKIDSIYLNPYTDSLKKGRHNYINVEGRTRDGKWLPLTSKEVNLTSNYGDFEGNDLILPNNFDKPKVKIRVSLKEDPTKWKEITLWIKTIPEPSRLPTTEEILHQRSRRN